MGQRPKQPKHRLVEEVLAKREADIEQAKYVMRMALVSAGFAIRDYVSLFEDPQFVKDHMASTPERFAGAMMQMLVGVEDTDPEKALKAFPYSPGITQGGIVVSGPHYFSSLCAHHLLPFLGVYVFGYIAGTSPKGQVEVPGLSKIPRTFRDLARRPSMQEHLGAQMCTTVSRAMNMKGTACLIRAVHCCMICRGVNSFGPTTTISTSGVLNDPNMQAQFFSMAERASGASFQL